MIAASPSPDASWTLQPGALIAVTVLVTVYVLRWRRSDAGVGRLLAALAGALVLLAALVSPIDKLGDQLLTMHMAQHLLLLDVAPVLILVSLTKVLLRPATRRLAAIERAAGPLAHPAFALALYVATMWFWHVPALYDAAADNAAIHVLEHMSFAGAGFLYWWHLLSPVRARLRFGGLGPVVYMVVTKLLVGLLGVGLAFAPDAIYSHYEGQPEWWGLGAETDQSVAGLVMALEQSLLMGVVLVWLFVRALGESEREQERAERYGDV